MSVYSGNRLPRDLVVQLCDAADNPTPEENVRIQLTRDAAALKVDWSLFCCDILPSMTYINLLSYNFYLLQGGNVFARLCLFVCLSVC